MSERQPLFDIRRTDLAGEARARLDETIRTDQSVRRADRSTRISESELFRRLTEEPGFSLSRIYIDELNQMDNDIRQALITGQWPDILQDDNASSSAARRYNRQRSMPRDRDSEPDDILEAAMYRLRQDNDLLRRENADLRKLLNEARAAAGWSNDDSPALGGQHRD